ncbi:WxL domain-containing protein [Enterococcus pallens]|uniref:Uncharacterized protein n=1 Tax=Enterococcus pallens ATCC BAA-351 TaxID=1158607 RepID=R2QH06_9ENTE|nr:WxL domain-containing protein [Enterococcus pallens]EOH94483.1 hypothetical protein UAU_02218 [Enterococcus pallens ATCC BAA-351]EOU24362.1 hypothetical protein I588_00349 [Enterococcus pallens ATCC BAA-351]
MNNYRKRIVLFFMTVVLISSTLSPAIVGAITEPTQTSETTAATEATTKQSSSTASSELTNATEGEETENSIEDTAEETSYEERELSDEALSDSPHPVVRIEEENRASLFVQNENDQQVTRLEKLVLQTKQAGTEWQDEQAYDIEDNYDLRESPYSFEYDTELPQRIIIEYSIEESQAGQLVKRIKHMAHYSFKELEKQEDSPSGESSEGDLSSENSETLSSDTLDAKLPDAEISSSPEKQHAAQDSATIPSSPPSEETNPFKRSLRGISPQAAPAPYVPSKEYKGPGGSLDYMTWITDITKSSANIKGKVPNMGDIQHVYLVWSTNKDDFGGQLRSDQMTPLENKILVTTTSTTPYQIEARLIRLQANLDYYIWFYAKTKWGGNYYTTFSFGTPDVTWAGGGTGAAGYNYYTFATDSAQELKLELPTITSTTKDSVVLGTSYYTGDITQTTNDGILEMTSNTSLTNWGNKFTNVQHETKRGITNSKGKINDVTNGRQVTGLTPGTKYQARLKIKDYGTTGTNGNVKSSGETTFYTKNSVESPVLVQNNPPVGTTKGSATFTGSYGYSSVPALAAHPNKATVRVNTGSGWSGDLTATTTPAVQVTKLANGQVAFTLTKLEPKTNYQVAYNVTNLGGTSEWAFLRGGSFDSRGLPLVLDAPKFNVTTDNAATLGLSGYTGDISPSENDGVLEMTSNTSLTVWQNKFTNVQHDIGRGTSTSKGKVNNVVNGRQVTGLVPGTKYQARLKIKDYGTSAQVQTSGETTVYTKNSVTSPVLNENNSPTTTTPASAVFTGSYGYNSVNSLAAHPTSARVRVNTGSGWGQDLTATTTPAVQIITLANGQIRFKLTNLSPKQKYHVAYNVTNQGGTSNWAFLNGTDNFDEGNFSTKGVKPDISPPIFLQTTATPTSIDMKSGTYTGDLGTLVNHGIIQTESYNVGAEKDSTANVTDLAHDPILKTYAGSRVEGLNPGTRYRGWVAFKDYGTNGTDGSYSYKERTEANGDPYYFYTTNSINNLTEPVRGMPTTANNATATFTAGYQAAGQHSAQVAAHPTKVKVFISTDGSSFDEITTSTSGPRLSRDDDIDSSAKTVTFKLEGLQENTRYYVKYSVVNQGGESPESTVYDFITLARPNGFYINQTPQAFDFGTVEMSENTMSHPLQNISGGGNYFSVDFENINMNSQWTLSAKLSKLQVVGGQQTLAGSSILMDKELKRTTDGGGTWETPDSTKFDSILGIQGSSISLPSDGETSVSLFKATDIPYGIGHFENRIAKDSVRLVIPGNTGQKGKTYSGKITWTMDNLI